MQIDRDGRACDGNAGLTTMVLAVGNCLLTDDGVGVHVLHRLVASRRRADVRYVDGGTLGFSLAPLIEEADRLVVLDAMRFGASPGSVALRIGEDLDRFVARKRATAHEVNLRDLLDMARLRGSLPPERALVGIEPASVKWGLEPSSAVALAIPIAVAAVESILESWAGFVPARSVDGFDLRAVREHDDRRIY